MANDMGRSVHCADCVTGQRCNEESLFLGLAPTLSCWCGRGSIRYTMVMLARPCIPPALALTVGRTENSLRGAPAARRPMVPCLLQVGGGNAQSDRLLIASASAALAWILGARRQTALPGPAGLTVPDEGTSRHGRVATPRG
jgi:hypothetical protein